MSKRDLSLFLEDIWENINLIENSIGQISKNSLQADFDKRDATIRRIEIIGEAVKNIPESFRKNIKIFRGKKSQVLGI